MNEICPVYKGMVKPIIFSYKLTMGQLLLLYKYLQALRILLTIVGLNVGILGNKFPQYV